MNIQRNDNLLSELIVEKTNGLIGALKEAEPLPLYIYGAGLTGNALASLFNSEGIQYSGMLSSRKYFKGAPNEYCLEEIMANAEEKVNIVVAHLNYKDEELEPYSNKINRVFNFDTAAGNMNADNTYMTFEWFAEHSEKLQTVYSKLADQSSKDTFAAYINQKISLKYGYLSKVKSSSPSYFEKDIIKLGKNETFVDCGAYDGDTAVEFVHELDAHGIHSYNSIISFEPDEANYKRLIARGLENHNCLKIGVSDRKGSIGFVTNNTGSTVCENSDYTIELDTIDNILDGKEATFIKMDIEGSELAALKGARETILKYKPTLAICIYHKKSDLYEIPEYIASLVPEYKIYVRAYDDCANEVVLYAVPPEK